MSRFIFVFAALVLFLLSSCIPEKVRLRSPDNKITVTFFIDENSQAAYDIRYGDEVVIDKSGLGFDIKGIGSTGKNVRIKAVDRTRQDSTWKPVFGEHSVYRDLFNQSMISLVDDRTGEDKMTIDFRVYNEGVAFRYLFSQDSVRDVVSELTEFAFSGDPVVWISSYAQSPINKMKLSQASGVFDRPILAEISDSLYVALGEAALVDFARMKFEKEDKPGNKFVARLENTSGTDRMIHGEFAVNIPGGGYKTPWRFIMIGESPSEILQNNFLVLNLNEENQITDHDWIKPGKVIREVTLTTQGGIACVDFAVRHNLQFIEFDAGWYGNEYEESSDATTITVDPRRSPGPLDLHHVIEYARGHGIGVLLYVNRRALEKQMDEILPLYKSWGVDGIKFGFVNVGSQYWTTWLHEAVRKAANHEIMVDIHDEYRPTGYSRTFPNLMTQEGIRGDEESTPNEMVINTIFTRMVAGAGDQTNCYFAGRVSLKMGSHASQMAKVICIYSPWQFLYWYDRPDGSPGEKGNSGGTEGFIYEIPDLEFFDKVPTVWDKTLVLDGYPGEFALIAREKAGSWFLGAITGDSNKNLKISLNFLKENTRYHAKIFSDDLNSGTGTNLKIEGTEVTCKSIFEADVLKNNGLAVIFTPVGAKE